MRSQCQASLLPYLDRYQPPTLLSTSRLIAPRPLHRTTIHIANRLRSYSAHLLLFQRPVHSACGPISPGIRCSSTEQVPHLALHGDHPGEYATGAASDPKAPHDVRLLRPSVSSVCTWSVSGPRNLDSLLWCLDDGRKGEAVNDRPGFRVVV